MAEPTSVGRDRGAGKIGGEQDWPARAADTIERVVGQVRDATTGRAITAARWFVYGLFAAILGSALLVMVAIMAVRFVDAYLPDAVFGERHTWAAHLLVGLVFTILGLVAWSRRSRSTGNTP
jgi:uncharacterized protein (DUF1810 family)